MDTVKLRGFVDAAGHLVLDLPLHLANHEVEVIVQVQADTIEIDELGWPRDFFERLDAIQADDMQERPEQLPFEERDEIE